MYSYICIYVYVGVDALLLREPGQHAPEALQNNQLGNIHKQ